MLKLIRAPPDKKEIFNSQVTESQRIHDDHDDDKQIFTTEKLKAEGLQFDSNR